MSERLSFVEMLKACDEKQKLRRLNAAKEKEKADISFTGQEAELLLQLLENYKSLNLNSTGSHRQHVHEKHRFIEEIERKLGALCQSNAE